MEFNDRVMTCVDCAQNFVFSAGEQVFFCEMQFRHDPKHCKRCRAKRVNVRARVETSVICAACGASTVVPFRPSMGLPVLCRSCFNQRQADGLGLQDEA